MNLRPFAFGLALCLGMITTAARADSLEGKIQSVNANDRSFVIQGQRFFTDGATEYEDGLKAFSDLKPGLKVQVDPYTRGGRKFAKEVELED